MPAMDDHNLVEAHLSEQELRDLYDNEQVERFLNLFSAYVTEVQLAQSSATAPSRPSSPPAALPEAKSISEEIAFRYLLPILPPLSPSSPAFTLGRLRLTTQRFYLAIQPYGPFFVALVNLATWKERQKSACYCLVFWSLWYYNLLLPTLFLRILYSLLRRKIFPYPTLAELHEYRQEIDRANEFGREMTNRFSPSSSVGMTELWRLFRVFNKPKKAKVRKSTKGKADKVAQESSVDPGPEENSSTVRKLTKDKADNVAQESSVDPGPEEDSSTVLDSEGPDSSQESDFKRAVLQSLVEITDLHERVQNIFIWRRPASSKVYGMALLFLFLVTLLLPAKYLAKLTYFVGGFFFWHITPVIAALPAHERARLPPAFADVPTDAEYAMERISQRVAAGLDVNPNGSSRKIKKAQDDVADAPQPQGSQKNKEVDWKKWGERAAVGMTWAEDGKRLFAGQWSKNPDRVVSTDVETHTFPAQHTSAPGLITLTTGTLFFTPLGMTSPKLSIPLRSLRGLKKKSGILNSLSINWEDAEGNAKEEKFPWIGGRDELFTRLVGSAEAKRVIKS